MLIIALYALPALAQQSSVSVTGTVVEEASKTPIEQATIRLLSMSDSTFIGGVASSRNGRFTLTNIKPGNYLLNISFIGYEPLYHSLRITGNTNPVNLGKLELNDGAIRLDEAVVVGKAAEVVVRNDTIEYNADSFKVTEGSTLEDLLKKMPGVEIDSEGKITVNGKEITKILVDGKEFFTDDPKVASKNLPSGMVDKVQVLDRLSEMAKMTGFDDGDEETVINLTVKKGMKQGWFGNAFAGYGSDDRYEANGMVNRFYDNDQFTVMGGINNTNNMGFTDLASSMFEGMGGGGGRGGGGGFRGGQNGITTSGNVGANFSKEFNELMTLGGNGRYAHSDNNLNSESTTIRSTSSGEQTEYDLNTSNQRSNNMGANFRMEWKPDTMTTIFFRPNLSYNKTNSSTFSNGYTLNDTNDTIAVSSSDIHSNGEGINLNGRLEFSRKLNNDGRILSASLSGGYNQTETDAINKTSSLDFVGENDEVRDQNIKYDNSGFNYNAFLSWVEPIGRNNFIQLTYSINQRKQDQLREAFNLDGAGNYNIIDTTQTQNFRNNYIGQRASLSFKSVREKFHYTIGFNVDPSHTSSERFIGDSTLYKITQNVVNFSPTMQFRFNFSKQSNLRIDYNGRTSQPSMNQMQPTPDYSNPNNIIIGNPDLKPRYSNNMFVRYQMFIPESQLALMVMGMGNYILNDIVSYTIEDAQGSAFKKTTYENVNGNFNGNIRVMLNTPLRNKKFTVSSMTMASYAKTKGFMGREAEEAGEEIIKGTLSTKNLGLMERASIDFRSNIIDIGVNGSVRYNDQVNNIPDEFRYLYVNNETGEYSNPSDLRTYDFSVGGRTLIYLPWEIKVESDITWSTNSGYTSAYKRDEVLWNASISKSFLKGNQATLRIKMYDILKERDNVSNMVSTGSSQQVRYNTINSYFMVNFIYRFNIFKGGASMNDVNTGRRGPRGPGGPPPGRF